MKFFFYIIKTAISTRDAETKLTIPYVFYYDFCYDCQGLVKGIAGITPLEGAEVFSPAKDKIDITSNIS